MPDKPVNRVKHPPRGEAVVMGGSAGALQALREILPALPERFPCPVVVATHVARQVGRSREVLFATYSRLQVVEAEDKEPVLPGKIYLAPADYHLMIEPNREFSLSREEKVNHSRPSIDVLFESASDAYGAGLVGVLLTGANHDGAQGLGAIQRRGGFALVQDPATAESRQMPEAAIALGHADAILPLREIGPWLASVGKSQEEALS